MISLQEKKPAVTSRAAVKHSIRNTASVNDSIAAYAKRDFAGAVPMHADDPDLSRAGRPPFQAPRGK